MIGSTLKIWNLASTLSIGEVEVPSLHMPAKDAKPESYLVSRASTPTASCTCPDFKYRGLERVCKHIDMVRRQSEAVAALARACQLEVINLRKEPVRTAAQAADEVFSKPLEPAFRPGETGLTVDGTDSHTAALTALGEMLLGITKTSADLTS